MNIEGIVGMVLRWPKLRLGVGVKRDGAYCAFWTLGEPAIACRYCRVDVLHFHGVLPLV